MIWLTLNYLFSTEDYINIEMIVHTDSSLKLPSTTEIKYVPLSYTYNIVQQYTVLVYARNEKVLKSTYCMVYNSVSDEHAC